MSVAINSKPKLLGADTHAPGTLAGSVVSNLTITQSFPAPAAGTCSGSQTDFQTIGSTSVTINSETNELFIRGQARFNLSSSNAMDVRLIRDNNTGDVLASLTTAVTPNATWGLSHTILNETLGAHSYQWQIRNTINPGELSCVTNTAFYNMLSEADDTHASTITGSNTQSTHETEILP